MCNSYLRFYHVFHLVLSVQEVMVLIFDFLYPWYLERDNVYIIYHPWSYVGYSGRGSLNKIK